MRKLLLLLAVLLTAGLLAPAVASATPDPRTTPSQVATAQAGAGLLAACKRDGFRGLYTPIPVGTAPVANDPATPADESKATVYTLPSRDVCRAVVNASLAVGLLGGLPAGTVSIPAPNGFPQPPRSVTPPPALAVLESVANGSATAPFTFTVKGTGLTPNADVSALVTYRDGRAVVLVVGKTNAEGVVTYPVAGACVKSQVPTAVTLLQLPAGPAATVSVPAQVCPGV